jgi:cytoplasmic FMR1 interacting protein
VPSEELAQENHILYLFLANQNSITTYLKQELQQIMGCATLASSSSSSRPSWPRVIFCLMQPPRRFDDIISMIVNQCALYVEEQRYVTPAEKHCLLRVMTYGLYLMDGEGPQNSQFNIFKSKKINLSRFSKLFKVRSSQKQKKKNGLFG